MFDDVLIWAMGFVCGMYAGFVIAVNVMSRSKGGAQ